MHRLCLVGRCSDLAAKQVKSKLKCAFLAATHISVCKIQLFISFQPAQADRNGAGTGLVFEGETDPQDDIIKHAIKMGPAPSQ